MSTATSTFTSARSFEAAPVSRPGFFSRLVKAIGESRARTAERELARHRHLMQHIAHPSDLEAPRSSLPF